MRLPRAMSGAKSDHSIILTHFLQEIFEAESGECCHLISLTDEETEECTRHTAELYGLPADELEHEVEGLQLLVLGVPDVNRHDSLLHLHKEVPRMLSMP